MWDVARNQSQIQNTMNSEIGEVPQELIGYWRLNEGEGIYTYDLSANNNDGTINGAQWVPGVS